MIEDTNVVASSTWQVEQADSAGPWWQGVSVVCWLSVHHRDQVTCWGIYCRMRYSSSGCVTGTVVLHIEGFRLKFYRLIFTGKSLRKKGGETNGFFGVCSARSLKMMWRHHSHFVDLLHLIGKEWRGLPAQSDWNKADWVLSENLDMETSPFSMAVRMLMQVSFLLL